MEKIKKNKRAVVLIAVVLAVIVLAAAFFILRHYYTIFNGSPVARSETYIDLRDMPEPDVSSVAEFNNPETIDLRGAEVSTEEIAALQEEYPDSRILWTVRVCEGLELENEATSVALADSSQLTSLIASAANLSSVQEIKVDYPNISCADYDALLSAFPDAEIQYSIALGGKELSLDAEKLDLSALTPEDAAAAVELVELLPNVSELDLSEQSGSSPFSLDQVLSIHENRPDIKINYSFELFGQSINTSTEYLEYYDAEIGDEGLDTFRRVIPIMHSLKYLRFDNCGTSDEAVARLRDEFPEVKIAWLLTVGKMSFYTDTLRLRVNVGFYPDELWKLKYCNEVRWIDFGHSWAVVDVEWARYMPDLEVCIVALTSVEDISPLAECKKLEFLEIFTTYVTDLSPLAELENLEYLNISKLNIDDITPLYGLEKLKMVNCNQVYTVPWDQINEFKRLHPDTVFNYNPSVTETGSGWRYAEPHVYTERYARLRETFQYDDISAIPPGYLQAPIE